MIPLQERLLDTAVISYVQRGQEPWVSRVLALPPARRCVPVVAYEEQMRGRLAQIRAAETRRDRQRLLAAYFWLSETARFFADVVLVPFDKNAMAQFEALRAQCPRVGIQDLKIASIALTRESVLVTPNVSDFAAVPHLGIEDWSVG